MKKNLLSSHEHNSSLMILGALKWATVACSERAGNNRDVLAFITTLVCRYTYKYTQSHIQKPICYSVKHLCQSRKQALFWRATEKWNICVIWWENWALGERKPYKYQWQPMLKEREGPLERVSHTWIKRGGTVTDWQWCESDRVEEAGRTD